MDAHALCAQSYSSLPRSGKGLMKRYIGKVTGLSRDRVLDPFGGSGSTLIACERTGRRAHMLELDPVYVDVMIRRWKEHSGKEATLEGDGRSFRELEAEQTPSLRSRRRRGGER